MMMLRSKRAKLTIVFSMLSLLLLLSGVVIAAVLSQQNQDVRQQASGGGWCTGQEQCPAGWYWGGGDDYCSSGLKFCTEGGAPAETTTAPGSTTTSNSCKLTGNSARYCDGEDNGNNIGPCTCRFSELGGNDCECLAAAGSCSTAGGTCFTGSSCSSLIPAKTVKNGGGGCSSGQVCCGGDVVTTSQSQDSGSTSGQGDVGGAPILSTICSNLSDSTCVGRDLSGTQTQCVAAQGVSGSCQGGTTRDGEGKPFCTCLAASAQGAVELSVASCTLKGQSHTLNSPFCDGNVIKKCTSAVGPTFVDVETCQTGYRCTNARCELIPSQAITPIDKTGGTDSQVNSTLEEVQTQTLESDVQTSKSNSSASGLDSVIKPVASPSPVSFSSPQATPRSTAKPSPVAIADSSSLGALLTSPAPTTQKPLGTINQANQTPPKSQTSSTTLTFDSQRDAGKVCTSDLQCESGVCTVDDKTGAGICSANSAVTTTQINKDFTAISTLSVKTKNVGEICVQRDGGDDCVTGLECVFDATQRATVCQQPLPVVQSSPSPSSTASRFIATSQSANQNTQVATTRLGALGDRCTKSTTGQSNCQPEYECLISMSERTTTCQKPTVIRDTMDLLAEVVGWGTPASEVRTLASVTAGDRCNRNENCATGLECRLNAALQWNVCVSTASLGKAEGEMCSSYAECHPDLGCILGLDGVGRCTASISSTGLATLTDVATSSATRVLQLGERCMDTAYCAVGTSCIWNAVSLEARCQLTITGAQASLCTRQSIRQMFLPVNGVVNTAPPADCLLQYGGPSLVADANPYRDPFTEFGISLIDTPFFRELGEYMFTRAQNDPAYLAQIQATYANSPIFQNCQNLDNLENYQRCVAAQRADMNPLAATSRLLVDYGIESWWDYSTQYNTVSAQQFQDFQATFARTAEQSLPFRVLSSVLGEMAANDPTVYARVAELYQNSPWMQQCSGYDALTPEQRAQCAQTLGNELISPLAEFVVDQATIGTITGGAVRFLAQLPAVRSVTTVGNAVLQSFANATISFSTGLTPLEVVTYRQLIAGGLDATTALIRASAGRLGASVLDDVVTQGIAATEQEMVESVAGLADDAASVAVSHADEVVVVAAQAGEFIPTVNNAPALGTRVINTVDNTTSFWSTYTSNYNRVFNPNACLDALDAINDPIEQVPLPATPTVTADSVFQQAQVIGPAAPPPPIVNDVTTQVRQYMNCLR